MSDYESILYKENQELTAKLQAAEKKTRDTERDLYATTIRAEAAETEVQRMNGTPEGGWFRAWETADKDRLALQAEVEDQKRIHATWDEWFRFGVDKTNEAIAERDRLQAEVERLRRLTRDDGWEGVALQVQDENAKLRNRIAELEAGLREIVRLPFECLDDCKDIANRLLDGRDG